MMKKNNFEVSLSLLAVILGAVFLRLIPHIPNISPVGALALFSGAMIPSWGGFALPLIAMVVSDLFLGFHATIPFVYGSFILIAGIGYLLRKKMSPVKIAVGSLSGSILFFLITNFGVWLTSPLYEKTTNGLLKCFFMGLPFFRNTVIGDAFYTVLFFVGYRVLRLLFVLMLPPALGRGRHVGNTV
jgi:hypothetical protein